jgi:hypothetical protein
MAVIQDVSRDNNQNGRVAASFGDGPFTRYVEVLGDVILVTDSDLDAEGRPVERHRNHDLRGRNFVPRSITARRSGFDGKLLLTLGGFTPDTGDSRRITVKCDLVIDPAT